MLYQLWVNVKLIVDLNPKNILSLVELLYNKRKILFEKYFCLAYKVCTLFLPLSIQWKFINVYILWLFHPMYSLVAIVYNLASFFFSYFQQYFFFRILSLFINLLILVTTLYRIIYIFFINHFNFALFSIYQKIYKLV